MKTFFKYFKRFSYIFWMLIAAFLSSNCFIVSICEITNIIMGCYSFNPLNCNFNLTSYIIFTIISIPLFVFIVYRFIKRIKYWAKKKDTISNINI